MPADVEFSGEKTYCKNMSTEFRIILSLICNLAIAVSTTVICIGYFRNSDVGWNAENGRKSFRFFTIQSNALCAAAALLMCIAEVYCLTQGNAAVPTAVLLLKYIGTAAVTVTLVTVLVYLGPAIGYPPLFAGSSFYMHLVGPLLAIVSFCFLEKSGHLSFAASLTGMLPVILYGALYLYKVIVREGREDGWQDFYGFNKDGRWKVSIVMMLIMTFLICFILRLLYNM